MLDGNSQHVQHHQQHSQEPQQSRSHYSKECLPISRKSASLSLSRFTHDNNNADTTTVKEAMMQHLLKNGNHGVSLSTSGRNRQARVSLDGQLKCHYCPKKWSDQKLLQLHMNDCRLIRIHECQHCGKRFKARGGLQQHVRIHSNERPYQCNFCTKRFTQKSHVDQHERIHTGAKPFSCAFCGRSFRQRSQQIGHESTHGGQGISAASPTDSEAARGQQRIENTISSVLARENSILQQQQQQQQSGHQLGTGQALDSSAASILPDHLGLLGLNTSCANTVTSLLALSQNAPPTTNARSNELSFSHNGTMSNASVFSHFSQSLPLVNSIP